MNKSESKYYNTACLMDEAFILLLDKKDYEYITVKEICEKAGVNRSTFYLHYETINDLLEESAEFLLRGFTEKMSGVSAGVIEKLRVCPIDDLYFMTPEYITPYLGFVKERRKLRRRFCGVRNCSVWISRTRRFSVTSSTPFSNAFLCPKTNADTLWRFT